MKGFHRENRLFSLCGLNCGLCTMHLGGYCGGCGNGNQPCKITRCSLKHGEPEYCYECGDYPCEKYEHVDDFDSFITHRRQKSDLERAQKIGIAAYNLEQQEKVQILDALLSNYNDGRRKTFFCVAVNLLELPELREAMDKIRSSDLAELEMKEKSVYVVGILQDIARRRNVELKLHKRKKS